MLHVQYCTVFLSNCSVVYLIPCMLCCSSCLFFRVEVHLVSFLLYLPRYYTLQKSCEISIQHHSLWYIVACLSFIVVYCNLLLNCNGVSYHGFSLNFIWCPWRSLCELFSSVTFIHGMSQESCIAT